LIMILVIDYIFSRLYMINAVLYNLKCINVNEGIVVNVIF